MKGKDGRPFYLTWTAAKENGSNCAKGIYVSSSKDGKAGGGQVLKGKDG